MPEDRGDGRDAVFLKRLRSMMEDLCHRLGRSVHGKISIGRSESDEDPEIKPPYLYLYVRRKVLGLFAVGQERRLFAVHEGMTRGPSGRQMIQAMLYPRAEDIVRGAVSWRLERLAREFGVVDLPEFVQQELDRHHQEGLGEAQQENM